MARQCTHAGCPTNARGGYVFCAKHGGSSRCSQTGCPTNAASGFKHCWKHGGHRNVLCEFPGCMTYANTGFKNCWAHGGYKHRFCKFPGCTTNASGGFKHCYKHGGVRCCSQTGCPTNATSGYEFCWKHGGAVTCSHTGCPTNAASGYKFCKSHGGGQRCEYDCCAAISNPELALKKHPVTDKYMCVPACRFLVNDAATAVEKDKLKKYFGFKRDLILRGEHEFYHKLVMAVPELALTERCLDESVLKKQLGKTKSTSKLRPDYYHYIGDGKEGGFAIYGEYDETQSHEDDNERLQIISNNTDAGWKNTYVFRVQAMHDTKEAVCVRRTKGEYTYYHLTDKGKAVVEKTAAIIRERLEWIRQGLPPSADRPQIVYI